MKEISIILAEFWGWFFIIFFFVLSINPKRILQILKDLRDQKFVIIIASLAIILGLINVLLYNNWKLNWLFIITLTGWLVLFMGLALFIAPKTTINWLNYINVKFVQIIYLFLFFTGIFFIKHGL